MLPVSLDRRGVWERMDICICVGESLCYPPETVTTLLIGYTSIQNLGFSHFQTFLSNYLNLKYPVFSFDVISSRGVLI